MEVKLKSRWTIGVRFNPYVLYLHCHTRLIILKSCLESMKHVAMCICGSSK